MLPIRYRDFWDVPRMFLVQQGQQLYLFDCPFDEATEDYGSSYRVYTMPSLGANDLTGSWADLPSRATAFLAEVPMSSIRFDPSRRQGIEAGVLAALTAGSRN